MEKGYLSLVLHAHLPYVRHPEHEHFLEEEWFYEALTETYIPLIKVFRSLISQGVDFRLTLSLTPTLLSMMRDPLLQSRYLRYLEEHIELTEKEISRTKNSEEFHKLAWMYHGLFKEAREIFLNGYGRDLTRAFKEFQDSGHLEIIGCAATHGFLPLLSINPEAVRAQIRVGLQTHEEVFGKKPLGVWLPECGFYPGLDEILKKEGMFYFVLESHGVLFGSARPKYGVFAPVYCRSGVAVFGRDAESSKSVWSAEEGYPGDFDYREFYRDIGYDLDYDYLRSYLNGDGTRKNTGVKYYRVTGAGNEKQPYSPERAREKAAAHAGNSMFNREHLAGLMKDRPPLLTAPYDAELFGHWWFEGPMWLYFLLKKIYENPGTFKTITPSDYLRCYPKNQVLMPSFSSWGYKGYAEVWLEGSNDWIYPLLHKAAERMIAMTNQFPDADDLKKRALNQMARELLLAQSSDWAFIMKTGTHMDYARKRTNGHLRRFDELFSSIQKNSIDRQALESIESTDNIFPNIDYRVYSSSVHQ
jgi:1,4-alpha-glucan branching enzyme